MHSCLVTMLLHQQPRPPELRRGKARQYDLPVCKRLQAQSHRHFQVVQTSLTAQRQSTPLARYPPACSCPTTGSRACLVSVGCKEKGERAELNCEERKRLMMGGTGSLTQLTRWPCRYLGRGWLGGKMALFALSAGLWLVYLMQKLWVT